MVMQPMPDMTADMAVWFMTPMFPKTLTVNGQVSRQAGYAATAAAAAAVQLYLH
jgi:hypothetical protein